MQLDADEDGEPFFRPPTIAPASLRPSDEQTEGEEHLKARKPDTSEPREQSEPEPGPAAITTAEQEG